MQEPENEGIKSQNVPRLLFHSFLIRQRELIKNGYTPVLAAPTAAANWKAWMVEARWCNATVKERSQVK